MTPAERFRGAVNVAVRVKLRHKGALVADTLVPWPVAAEKVGRLLARGLRRWPREGGAAPVSVVAWSLGGGGVPRAEADAAQSRVRAVLWGSR